MGRQITESDVRTALLHRDPLGAWLGGGATWTYEDEARLAFAGMNRIAGVGHFAQATADALDQLHPGAFEQFRNRGSEFNMRIRRVARDLWDIYGMRLYAPQRSRPSLEVVLPIPPRPRLQPDVDSTALIEWLRHVDRELSHIPSSVRSADAGVAIAFREELRSIVDEYGTVDDQSRHEMRSAFSRFRLVQNQLSTFIAEQYMVLKGGGDVKMLRHALIGESLLDGGIDWRDELMLLRDLRAVAASAALPFADCVHEAAALSGTRTAEFLLGLLGPP